MGIINKYCASNILFNKYNGLNIADAKIIQLLEGKHTADDKEENYNSTFFEISLALRFVGNPELGDTIDLTSECDVVCGKELGIECKYIFSENQFESNLSYALHQLDKRFDKKIAKIGLVALDLSKILDKQKTQKTLQDTFNYFADSYEEIISSRRYISEHLKQKGIVDSVLADRNFNTIINTYMSHEAEKIFHKNLTTKEIKKLDNRKLGIIYQTNNFLYIEHENQVIPTPFRTLNYFLNPELTENQKEELSALIKSLVGTN